MNKTLSECVMGTAVSGTPEPQAWRQRTKLSFAVCVQMLIVRTEDIYHGVVPQDLFSLKAKPASLVS